jgi:hypothetical protein
MAAKKKTTIKSENDGKGTKAQVAAFKTTKSSVKPTAALTNKGQKPTGLRSLTPAEVAARKANESKPRTPIKNAKSGFAGSSTPLGASFGVSKITKGDVAKAVLAAVGGGAVSGSKIVTRTVVSEATKKLQRELSKKQKDINMKGMSRQQRIVEGERRSELTPEEYMENFSRGKVKDMKKDVSKSMKELSKKKIVVKKK